MQGLKELLRVDVTEEQVSQCMKHYREGSFIGLGNYPPEKNHVSMRRSDVAIGINVAVFRHLGCEISESDLNLIAKPGSDIAVDYFYGPYFENRDGSSRPMRKRYGAWLDVYRNGLMLALVFRNEEAIRKLTEWIEPTLPFDETSHTLTILDNNYHKLLTEFLRPGDAVSQNLRESFAECKLKRPKLLIDCLDAIIANDSAKFSASLAAFLSYYKKIQFNKGGFDSLFSIEGSILWHVAERVGIESPRLSPKQSALVMTRDTLGLPS